MGALPYGCQKLLWKSKSHISNLKHWSLHHPQYTCCYGQMPWYPYKHILLNLFLYILKSWTKEAYLSVTWRSIRKKIPPQMFLAFLAENARVECNQSHFHSRLHKLISKVPPMYRYIIVANIHFSGRKFFKTISCFRQGFYRCQKFKFILQMQL